MSAPYDNIHRIRCTKKANRGGFESILVISGPDGTWTKTEAADAIRAGADVFYTAEDGTTAVLIAERGTYGWYVRTTPDCTPANNLLNLPDCF